MQVALTRPHCPTHHQPYSFICTAPSCPCPVRLCQECLSTHPPDAQYTEQPHFIAKVQVNAEAINKQYSFVHEQRRQPLPPSSKQEDIFRVVENAMRGMQSDKRRVYNTLEELKYSHSEVRKKLNQNRHSSYAQFMSSISSGGLAPALIGLSSQKGLERVYGRLQRAKNSIKRYQQFIASLDNYGKDQQSLLNALNLRDKLLRNNMQEILSKQQSRKRSENSIQHIASSPKRPTKPMRQEREGALGPRVQVRLPSRSPSREKIPTQQVLPSLKQLNPAEKKRPRSASNKQN